MAYLGKVVQFTDASGNTYDLPTPESSEADAYVYVNDSGNVEVSSDPDKPTMPVTPAADAKLNLVSKGDIQVKPGTSSTLQFDCEKSAEVTKDAYEFSFKVCNGALPKATRVVATKWNTAQWTFDTQKANTTSGEGEFDLHNFIMQFRLDKWNGGTPATDKGPIAVKLKGQSFDMRCHGHGGIALQPAGEDSDHFENKIKFESSRTNVIGSTTKTYNVEGGKGLEFGTFNNEHSSLFTGSYRFRANAPIYAACRGTLVTAEGKTDYPTQADDFKDILPTDTDVVTWADLVNAVRYIKSGSTDSYATWLSTHKLSVPATGVDGFDSNNMEHPA